MRVAIVALTLLAAGGVLVPARGRALAQDDLRPWSPTTAPQDGAPGAAPGVPQPLAEVALEAAPEASRAVPRHAGDERFFFTPGARLLEPGTVVLSDDEVMLLHLGVGVSRRVQMDLTIGALPIPGAAGGAVPAHGLLAGGGAGIVVLGAVTLGAKVLLLDEGPKAPGIVAAYDFVDLFGGALGGAGFVILGNGVAGAGVGAIGGANLQLNVLSLAVNKHFGRRWEFGAGSFVIDNHHFVPQVAGFTSVDTTGSSSSGAGAIARLPTKLLPFLDAEVWLGAGFSSILEVFPQAAGETFGTLGLRWVSGRRGRAGLARWIRVRFDAAAVWGRGPDTSTREGSFGALPWLGLGVYLF